VKHFKCGSIEKQFSDVVVWHDKRGAAKVALLKIIK
jgi:hypothetical protein